MLEQDYVRYQTAAETIGDTTAPIVYFMNMHGGGQMDFGDSLAKCPLNVVNIYASDWDNDLTPWHAPNNAKSKPDFEGNAAQTLKDLIEHIIPQIETVEGLTPQSRAIAGYSLGGLFSTYAFINCATFKAMASMSGSLWFPDWSAYMHQKCDEGASKHAFEGRFAYFSIGKQEPKSPPKILSTVVDRNHEAAELLKASGAQTEFYLGPGNHFQHIPDRCARGLDALTTFFTGGKVRS